MKAAVCTRYGPPEVLQLQDVGKPIPKDGEVLVKIHATTVTSSDWLIRSGIPRAPLAMRIMMRLVVGIRRPRKSILGLVLAGEVAAAGKAVSRFRAGDRVFAFTGLRFGCYAPYACVSEKGILVPAPSNLTYEEAAAIPYGGLLALWLVRKGNMRSGQQVLIYGASGAVGTAAVQLAKHFGAEVTAVCSTTNLELARSLGADTVMDYTQEHAPSDGKLYDLVVDAVGKRKTSSLKVACSKALAPGGKYISVDDGTPNFRPGDLVVLKELAEAGKVRPVVDRRYPL
jgi:NADPH:quinone reductase-like Zn-dependent oxidoreductase